MTVYSRRTIVELLQIDEGFVRALEQEEIIETDTPEGSEGEFSEQMLERARVADTLVRDLEVNLAGVAIIIRMREEIADLKHKLGSALHSLRSSRSS